MTLIDIFYIICSKVGDNMYHLVIAKDKECKQYIPIKSGDYNFICKYTTKYDDSNAIRSANKKTIRDFEDVFNDYGDIVVIDDTKNNKRVKVLYKRDMIIFNTLIYSQKYIQNLVQKKIINNLSEWDYRVIMFRDNKSYKKDIKNEFEKRSDYYLVVLSIIKNYDEYRKLYPNLPSKNDIYNAYMKDKKSKKKVNDDTIDYDNRFDLYNIKDYSTSAFFDKVYDLYMSGGIGEVLNTYSLDDLYNNLKGDELELIHMNGYHR